MRVLIANENQTERDTLARLLSGHVDIAEAEDGYEVLSHVEQAIESGSPFAMVILDLALPQVDNLDVVTAMRHLEESHGVWGKEAAKVVALFDCSGRGEQCETDLHGCEDVLPKPIDGKKIIQLVLKLKEATSDPRDYVH